MKNKMKGVGIIEMMVVMVIAIILALIGMVKFSDIAEKATRSATLVALKGVRDGLSLYYTDRRGYTTITPELGPYVNITGLSQKFDAVEITVISSAYCISGIIANITPLYNVTHCISTPLTPTARTEAQNQPSCCWAKVGVNCAAAAATDWYACRSKM